MPGGVEPYQPPMMRHFPKIVRPLDIKGTVIQVIRRNQVYFSCSNVSTDKESFSSTTCRMKSLHCFKITIKWNLTKSRATRLKSAKYKLV